MSDTNNTSIPKGSLVLVTGANGFIGSHVAKQFLERGYRVRGAVRDAEKYAFMLDEVFPEYSKRGDFELVSVPDLGKPNAYDDAIIGSGVAAIVHVASPLTFDPDPNNVIPQTIEGAMGLLKAAAREPSVKQFVFTSSAPVSTPFPPGSPGHITKDTWADPVVQLAWAPPPYEPHRGGVVYLSSKLEAEKAIWKFVEEEKPAFDVNTVLPYTTMGQGLHKSQLKGTSGWIQDAYNGKVDFFASLPVAFHVDVRDVAALHVAAVLDPEIKGERFFAWAKPVTVNVVLEILRGMFPDHTFIDDIPNKPLSPVTKDDTFVLSVLKKWAGRDDWISLEETVRDGLKPLP
ncbi:putative NAD dependent epimerase/dehydratase [Thozetella sp. PMI_491]|nr:putative NAD dependent epimerase/dehydratase [Thozetella sp. PMI_491]